jgi:hypothetical protein
LWVLAHHFLLQSFLWSVEASSSRIPREATTFTTWGNNWLIWGYKILHLAVVRQLCVVFVLQSSLCHQIESRFQLSLCLCSAIDFTCPILSSLPFSSEYILLNHTHSPCFSLCFLAYWLFHTVNYRKSLIILNQWCYLLRIAFYKINTISILNVSSRVSVLAYFF